MIWHGKCVLRGEACQSHTSKIASGKMVLRAADRNESLGIDRTERIDWQKSSSAGFGDFFAMVHIDAKNAHGRGHDRGADDEAQQAEDGESAEDANK